ncbi:hypothetical protein CEXT_798191 [Caerostris extrusa]|uniref:MATH domain-containing protein n=1 Tax=Caerostris extrusa TaxID=172846 RepID=A0AAV4RF63_CAEEX|nr:hypothetical protein CEXT_798191 [Caerostris extrusa]
MSSTEEKFTLIWKIENVSFTTKCLAQPILSPCFNLNSMDKTRWFLKFYARGVSSERFLSVWLCRDDKDSVQKQSVLVLKDILLLLMDHTNLQKKWI